MIDFQNVTTIIFDFGGVLIDLKLENAVKKFADFGVKNVDRLLNTYKQDGIFLEMERGKITAEEFRNAFRKENNTDLSDKNIDFAYMQFLLGIPKYKLDMLLELRKHFRVIMLSNTNPIHFEFCIENHFNKDGYTIDDYFDKCYLSYKMGVVKPDADIFHQLLKEEDCKAENCLFIDDGPANIDEAKNLGFKTYLAKPEEDFRFLFKEVL